MGGEPEPTWAKDGRPGLDIEAHIIEDSTQAAGLEMGWLKVQTA
jgi:hypothetical protein